MSNVATVYNSATEQFFLDTEQVVLQIEETLYRYALTEPEITVLRFTDVNGIPFQVPIETNATIVRYSR